MMNLTNTVTGIEKDMEEIGIQISFHKNEIITLEQQLNKLVAIHQLLSPARGLQFTEDEEVFELVEDEDNAIIYDEDEPVKGKVRGATFLPGHEPWNKGDTTIPNKRKTQNGKAPTSQYLGLSFNKNKGLYTARITHYGEVHYLGYGTEQEMAIEYDKMAIKLRGAKAITNFPKENYK